MNPRKQKPKYIDYNAPFDRHGFKAVRWVENVSCGLRLVGFADEITRKADRYRTIDHKGWFTRDEQDGDVFRGVVYQLPARSERGRSMYVYGYADPYNDDCALLCFDALADGEMDDDDVRVDAARAADRFAEIFAEHERDYQRAWDAGNRYAELGDQVVDMRDEALRIGREMRELKQRGINITNASASCKALRGKIGDLYRAIVRARKERGELADNYGRQEAFKENAGEVYGG